MKILYLTDTFLPQINGLITSVVNFSENLEKRGHDIRIFTTENKSKVKIGKNIDIKYFKASSFLINYPDFVLAYPNIYRTMTEIKKFSPDIIHTHTPSPQAWVALTAAKISHIPFLSTYHTLLPEFIKHTYLAKLNIDSAAKMLTWGYTRAFYNKVDMVIAPSMAMRAELIGHKITKPITAVSNGIDTAKFRPKKRNSKNIKILHVGRISYEKNIQVILEAFGQALKKDKTLQFTIAGGGPDLEKLKELSKKQGLSASVEFTGPIPHEKIDKIYSDHDIFLTASTIETEGLVILEAMATGMPVIGVDALAIPEIIKQGYNGYVAKPYNSKEISRYLLKLSGSGELRERFGAKSVEISKDYDLNKSIYKIENIYMDLLEKARSSKR
jgi:1,2-diacylglycerol 3-alpha-glucosyltransferase